MNVNEAVRSAFEKENIFELEFLSVSDLPINKSYLLPNDAKTAVVWLLPYYVGRPSGNISLYARSRDYHEVSKLISERVISSLKKEFPKDSFYNFADHSPISEVYAASLAGLGVIGKNKLLINRRYGSFVFVCALFTTLEADTAAVSEPKDCISCGKCMRECPSGCAVSGKMENCLSGITQKKGELTPSQEEAVVASGSVWGCDVCQLVCPMNEKAEKTPVTFFYEDRIESLDTETLLAMSDCEFSKRAFSFRGKAPLLRNLRLFERKNSL